MRSLWLGALLVLSFGVLPARATLMAVDLAGGPADEATLDDATGLLWYDVSETVNVSYDDAPSVAQAATGLVWRHATGAEVCALLGMYADPAFGCSGDPLVGTSQVLGDVSAAFRDLLGATFPGADFIFGFYDDGDANPLVGNASTNAFVAGVLFTLTAVGPNDLPSDVADSITGNWLVAVPEPATATLLALGLAAGAVRSQRD